MCVCVCACVCERPYIYKRDLLTWCLSHLTSLKNLILLIQLSRATIQCRSICSNLTNIGDLYFIYNITFYISSFSLIYIYIYEVGTFSYLITMNFMINPHNNILKYSGCRLAQNVKGPPHFVKKENFHLFTWIEFVQDQIHGSTVDFIIPSCKPCTQKIKSIWFINIPILRA